MLVLIRMDTSMASPYKSLLNCENISSDISYTKYSSNLNLGEGLCIFTSFHLPDSGLYLLDSFDFYFDLFWMAWQQYGDVPLDRVWFSSFLSSTLYIILLKIEGKTDWTDKIYKFICPIFWLDKTSLDQGLSRKARPWWRPVLSSRNIGQINV